MNESLFQLPVYCAFGGALAIKLLELAELQHVSKTERPDFTDVVYWLPYLIMPLLGAGLAYVYIVSAVQPFPCDFDRVDPEDWVTPVGKGMRLTELYASSILLNEGFIYTLLSYDEDCLEDADSDD